MVTISTNNLGKKYGNNRLFKNLDLQFEQPGQYAVTGFNGSGKSTLLLCLSRFVTPTEGHVQWSIGGKNIPASEEFKHLAFCSPALELFEELTLQEHLDHHHSFVKTFDLVNAKKELERYGIKKALSKNIKSFSSGMKQRLKLLLAFNNDVPVLFLDEPCSNLDEAGVNLYRELLLSTTGKQLVIVATNQVAVEFPVAGRVLNLQDLAQV